MQDRMRSPKKTVLFTHLMTLSIAGSISLCCLVPSNSARAQIIPDSTLGAERSIVTPNVNINGLPSDRIDGGAKRGANLFHSFGDFNVGAGRGVYFSNPAGIENILSRVTGNNLSNIQGTLGVLGNANLFLINPNGIIFGPSSRLDVRGSFVATTASSLVFGNGLEFSATNPQAPPLLTINFPPGLQYRSNQPGVITNAGNLSVGQDLTLAAGNLDLQGQLQAGRNLTLQAKDTVRVRDSATSPFIASSGGQFLVQGNQGVDIFALNHPASGFFSGADMVLRSANTIGGDAHYTADGNFRIEKLDGSLGSLLSSQDPVIRSLGDVSFYSYQGASLHILAAGKVEIPGYVWIQGADPVNGLIETVTLSNGSSISINGKREPTLDIRAGMNPAAVGSPLGATGFRSFGGPLTSAPSSADIKIGTILFADTAFNFLAGRVLLTNQYQPNPSLKGDIQVTDTQGIGAITTGEVAKGGSVTIDSRGSFTLNGTVNASAISASSMFRGNGGDVAVLAKGDITLTLDSLILSNGLLGGNITLKSDGAISVNSSSIFNRSYTTTPGSKGGDINLIASSLSLTGGAQLNTGTFGRADAGNVNINVRDIVSFDGVGSNGFPSGVFSGVGSEAAGKGGDINITTGTLFVTGSARLDASTYGKGDAGSVNINARNTVTFDGVGSNGISSGALSNVWSGAAGKGGGISITAGALSVTKGATVNTLTSGQGDAGSVNINARETVTFDGVGSNGLYSGVISGVGSEAAGKGGDINITTGTLFVTGGGILGASTSGKGDAGSVNIRTGSLLVTGGGILGATTNGQGNAGSVNINARDTVTFDGERIVSSGAYTFVATGAGGKGGDINIFARSLFLSNGASLGTSVLGGQGNSGNILVSVTDSISVNSGASIATFNLDQGNGGNITLRAGEKVSISGSGSDVSTSQAGGVFGNVGNGNAGNINVQTRSLFLSDKASLGSEVLGGQGDSGNIQVKATDSIFINGGADIGTFNTGQGNGGNVTLLAGNQITLSGGSRVSTVTFGNGKSGNIDIQTRSLSATNGAALNSFTFGGGAGIITILASDAVSFDGVGGGVYSTAVSGAVGSAGSIRIGARSLSLTNGAGLNTLSQESSAAGSIEVTTAKDIHLDNQAFISSNTSGGQGNINLHSRDLFLRHNSRITTNATGTATGGNITINTGNLVAVPKENSDISANAEDSFGGRISITAAGIFGTKFRPQLTPLSDITASSKLGPQFNGTVQLNIISPDPSRGLAQLPQNVVDPASQIAQNPCTRGKSSEFTITGRGGLPPNPNEALSSEAVGVGLVEPTSQAVGEGFVVGAGNGDRLEGKQTTFPQNPPSLQAQMPSHNSTSPNPPYPPLLRGGAKMQNPIVPAQGWVFNDRGEVVLTAYNPTATGVQRPWRNPSACPER